MRSNIAWNVVTVVLLGGILVGVVTIPKFNYGTLVQKNVALELRQKTLEARIEKVQPLTSEDAGRRLALFGLIDSIPSLLSGIEDRLSLLPERQAELANQLMRLEERLRKLEESLIQNGQPVLPSNDLTFTDVYTSPIELSEDLRKRAEALSPRGVSELTWEEFLSHALDQKVLPYARSTEIPRDSYSELLRLFSVFKWNLELINFEERLHVSELAESATESGDYEDVPIDLDEAQLRSRMQVPHRGVLHVEVLHQSGVRRFFKFPFETFPEFEHYQTQRANARDHLVRDMLAVAKPPVADARPQ